MKQLYVPGPWPDEPFEPSREAVHRLRYVLRSRGGDEIVIADGHGLRATCRWTGKFLDIVSSNQASSRRRQRIIAAGLLKGERWDVLLEKCVEIGIDRIVPLQLQHNVVRIKPTKVDARLARWRTRTVEAFEQCGRARLPSVAAPMPLDAFIAGYNGTLAVADERGGQPIARWIAGSSGDVGVVIGPEGGLAQVEIEQLERAGATRVTLSPNVLRAETAAIVAATAICADS